MALVFMGLAAAVAVGCGSGGVSGELDATADTTVTADTKEQTFAMKRQLFLTEQGYRYHIEDRKAG